MAATTISELPGLSPTTFLRRNVLFPAWHLAKLDGVNRAIRELSRNQWRSADELRGLQQRKLSRLLDHAANLVPYYRRLFSDYGIVRTDQFAFVPPLTKAIIRDADLISEDLRGNRLTPNTTSGSTGEALYFFTDARSMPYRQAAAIRSNEFSGVRHGERSAALWGSPIDQSKAQDLRGRVHGWVTGNAFLSSYDLSDAQLERYAARIREHRPRLLVGYPGPLEEFAKRHPERFPSLRAIVSSAETLWPHQRQTIESAFGVPVFNRYGCREVGQIASECEYHHLHVSVDRVVLEIVDDDGAPASEGRILVTDLDNYGMPLIRYDIGDRGVRSDAVCPCGRGLPLLERVEGRTMEVIHAGDKRIGGTYWTILLRSRPGLRQIQLAQDSADGVTIRFVRESSFQPDVLDYFRRRIQEHCGADFAVRFEEVDAIPLTPSGKQRLIISALH